ncbi:hypothetical protein KUCAC02_029518 [Chaenocephalus aceratus]|nr:hypothetical protein KUCAC02_029518 [Chaenocephalus aceratus]
MLVRAQEVDATSEPSRGRRPHTMPAPPHSQSPTSPPPPAKLAYPPVAARLRLRHANPPIERLDMRLSIRRRLQLIGRIRIQSRRL